MILIGRDQLIGEVIIFVDDNVQRGGLLLLYIRQQSIQIVRDRGINVNFRHLREKSIFIAHGLDTMIAMHLKTALDGPDALARFNNGKVEMNDEAGVLFAGGVLSDPGVTKQFLETVCGVDIVIIVQDGAEQGLAESARAEKDRVVDLFQLGQPVRLIDKIAVFFHQLGVVGDTVEDAFFHVPLWIPVQGQLAF